MFSLVTLSLFHQGVVSGLYEHLSSMIAFVASTDHLDEKVIRPGRCVMLAVLQKQ